jgi:putative ABC transport system permease protein
MRPAQFHAAEILWTEGGRALVIQSFTTSPHQQINISPHHHINTSKNQHMIPTIAWRNIWRNPTRSWVVIGAIAIGIWAALFMSGFATGMVRSYVNNAIANSVGHIQMHAPNFTEDYDVKLRIADVATVAEKLGQEEEMETFSIRSVTNGMISSTHGARGIRIKAVDAAAERAVSGLDQKLEDGTYFEGKRKNQLLISTRLADKLEAKVRTKLVVTFQNLEGDITAGAFRVVGLFNTGNAPFDESHIFVQQKDLNRLLADSITAPADIAHEVSVIIKDPVLVDTVRTQLAAVFPALKVETYREISPDLELYENQIQSVSWIYLTIIMLALVFGIINTMLMAVLERIRELGMLMAIGMNKVRVFLMIVLETLLLGLVGAPLGLLLGWGTISYLGEKGMDLSAYSETMQQYGMSEVVYFGVDPIVYWQVPIAVFFTALIASIYPALKAIRLRPVEAIRKL